MGTAKTINDIQSYQISTIKTQQKPGSRYPGWDQMPLTGALDVKVMDS
jgi:hypothetical protein